MARAQFVVLDWFLTWTVHGLLTLVCWSLWHPALAVTFGTCVYFSQSLASQVHSSRVVDRINYRNLGRFRAAAAHRISGCADWLDRVFGLRWCDT